MKTSRHHISKALDKLGRFHAKCRSAGCCRDLFESTDAKGVEKSSSCHLCNKTLTLERGLQLRMNSVHSGLRFQCPIATCSKKFTRMGHLNQHRNAVHTKKNVFECTKCAYKYYYKSALTQHLANKHGRRTTYSCYLCQNTFSFNYNLQQQMRSVHLGLRPFQCPIPKYLKKFTGKCNMTRHTDARKKYAFKCADCAVNFHRKVLLSNHLANKNG